MQGRREFPEVLLTDLNRSKERKNKLGNEIGGLVKKQLYSVILKKEISKTKARDRV